MLRSLFGGAPASQTGASLADLLGGERAHDGERMTLPQAMLAIERGEIPRPADSALGVFGAPDERLPLRPQPAPKRLAYQDELDAQQREDEQAAEDMLVRARARRTQQQL
jgi:hypothetical protein